MSTVATVPVECHRIDSILVRHWRTQAWHSRELAEDRKNHEAQAVFKELNGQIKVFLRSPRNGHDFHATVRDLSRLLSEVFSWQEDSAVNHLPWTWTFHHAPIQD